MDQNDSAENVKIIKFIYGGLAEDTQQDFREAFNLFTEPEVQEKFETLEKCLKDTLTERKHLLDDISKLDVKVSLLEEQLANKC
jgi:cell division septum initiation protein DivIVA